MIVTVILNPLDKFIYLQKINFGVGAGDSMVAGLSVIIEKGIDLIKDKLEIVEGEYLK